MSDPVPTCFWLDATAEQTPLHLVNGVYLCTAHAKCTRCAKPLIENVPPQGIACHCEDYGQYGHDEYLFCSRDCLEAAHDGPEPEEEEP